MTEFQYIGTASPYSTLAIIQSSLVYTLKRKVWSKHPNVIHTTYL